jgi:hypothetical protein
MFITKKHLSRRTFLKGVGVTLSLPFLDAMVPAATPLAQTAAQGLQRFGFIYVPMGSIMKQWTPEQTGSNFAFSPILKPLEPFREYVNVLSNFYNTGENGHSVSCATYMSGTVPAKGEVTLLNTTVDQMIAQKIGLDSTFPSMEFATEDHTSHLGSCAGDFLCAYMSTISWRTPTQPLPMEINPRIMFETMFGGDQSTPEARAARLEQNTSILDGVRESVRDLETGLGVRDKAKLDEYLENVREIERRMTQGERQRRERNIQAPATPIGIPDSIEDHINIMFDLQALALQGNMTRVISFMLSRELTTVSYPQIGVQDGHHPISHNNNVPEQVAKKAKVDTFHLELFARFLNKLKNVQEGERSLLENSLWAYGSGMSNGNQHNHQDLPFVLVGGAGGKLQGNRHLKTEKPAPLSNVWVSVLELAGIPTEKYAESSGRFEL